MSGYTPVFNSVFTGTLYGRYPDTAAWLYLLALSDKNGVVDMTPQAIAGMTGMPVEDLLSCIKRFEQPDPDSRSSEEEGRRLVRLDPNRPWGWRLVNHSKYRERARKQYHNEQAVVSGANRDRMATRRDQTRPDATSGDPLSDSDTDTNKDRKVEPRASRSPTAARLPEDFSLTDEMESYARAQGISEIRRTFESFCDYWRAESGAKARKHDWLATWRTWCRRTAERKPTQERRSAFVPIN